MVDVSSCSKSASSRAEPDGEQCAELLRVVRRRECASRVPRDLAAGVAHSARTVLTFPHSGLSNAFNIFMSGHVHINVLKFIEGEEGWAAGELNRADLWVLHVILDRCERHGKRCSTEETQEAVRLLQSGEACAEEETTRKHVSAAIKAIATGTVRRNFGVTRSPWCHGTTGVTRVGTWLLLPGQCATAGHTSKMRTETGLPPTDSPRSASLMVASAMLADITPPAV